MHWIWTLNPAVHDRMVMDPKSAEEMTTCEKKGALQYLMCQKQKRCGNIKGRGCADGIKQREYVTNDDTSAPTVATEALFLTCLISSMEHHKVATVDIPGALMQLYMEGETVHMKMEGKNSYLLTKLNPTLYHKYAKNNKGRTVLYVDLKRVLYGTLQAALLFWKNLTSILQEWGFEVNPYD